MISIQVCFASFQTVLLMPSISSSEAEVMGIAHRMLKKLPDVTCQYAKNVIYHALNTLKPTTCSWDMETKFTPYHVRNVM